MGSQCHQNRLMAGSTAHEQYLVAETALATGRIKTVLWGLDEPSFAWPARAVRDDQAPFPYYLYRKRGPNLEYLLSLSTLRLSLLALNGNGGPTSTSTRSGTTALSWAPRPS